MAQWTEHLGEEHQLAQRPKGLLRCGGDVLVP